MKQNLVNKAYLTVVTHKLSKSDSLFGDSGLCVGHADSVAVREQVVVDAVVARVLRHILQTTRKDGIRNAHYVVAHLTALLIGGIEKFCIHQ